MEKLDFISLISILIVFIYFAAILIWQKYKKINDSHFYVPFSVILLPVIGLSFVFIVSNSQISITLKLIGDSVPSLKNIITAAKIVLFMQLVFLLPSKTFPVKFPDKEAFRYLFRNMVILVIFLILLYSLAIFIHM